MLGRLKVHAQFILLKHCTDLHDVQMNPNYPDGDSLTCSAGRFTLFFITDMR